MTDSERRRAANEATRRWRQRNPEKVRAQRRAWAAAHPGYQTVRRNANLERARAQYKRWRDAHLERARAQGRAKRNRRIEAARASAREWLHAHKDHKIAIQNRYRARKRGAEGTYSVEEWAALLASHGSCCGYCGSMKDIEQDHRVPLSRGGTNYISNIIPACRLCNSAKCDRTEEEFREFRRGSPPQAVRT